MIGRRSFIAGILASAAAPAIITRPGLLMPVREIVVPPPTPAPVDLRALAKAEQADWFAEQMDRIGYDMMLVGTLGMYHDITIHHNRPLQSVLADHQRGPNPQGRWVTLHSEWAPDLIGLKQ